MIEGERDAISNACLRHGVVRLQTFGSALRTDWDVAKSDFDLLAEFSTPPLGINRFHQLVDFILELERLLNRRVDVATGRRLGIQSFGKTPNSKPPLNYPEASCPFAESPQSLGGGFVTGSNCQGAVGSDAVTLTTRS
jgi:predicted nucleotidyltransferase